MTRALSSSTCKHKRNMQCWLLPVSCRGSAYALFVYPPSKRSSRAESRVGSPCWSRIAEGPLTQGNQRHYRKQHLISRERRQTLQGETHPPVTMSTTTTTLTTTSHNTQMRPTLHLVGADRDLTQEGDHQQPGEEYQYQYAAHFDPEARDPNRFEAANDPNWDYTLGNPINPIWQGQNTEIRDNHNPRTYYLFRGVNFNGVSLSCP